VLHALDIVQHERGAASFRQLRERALEIVRASLAAFAELGVARVNLHPDSSVRLLGHEEIVRRNVDAVALLAEEAAARRLELMVENMPGPLFADADDLRPLVEHASFHLDVGHANLGGQRLGRLLEAFGDRLRHVHVSDNFGKDDLHLPLGAGAIDWPAAVAALKGAGWDGTVTLEVHSPERVHLETSRRLWLEWWGS
jgi:sugar phosphate isomerase/epimerase